MKPITKQLRKGFTLIELTVAMLVGMAIGAMVLAMLNQQIAFLKIFGAQSFLNEEAPIISSHVSKLLASADGFRLHNSLDDARNRTPLPNPPDPPLTEYPVLVLTFRQPDGSRREGILSFEDLGQGDALNYYVVPLAGPPTTPSWSVTTKPSDVVFFVESGILRCRLTGPAEEEITFSGAMQ